MPIAFVHGVATRMTQPGYASSWHATEADQLRYWWNTRGGNDFISYSVRNTMDGADDEPHSSGLSVPDAPSGYLRRPSFYRRLASDPGTAHRVREGRRG